MSKKIGDIKLNIDIDTTQAQRSVELLGKALCNLRDECARTEKKQPHVRIEFDNISEVPDVFIDGVQVIGSDCEKSVLSRLFINWNTNTDIEMAKQFEMKTLDSKGIYNVTKQGDMYGD